MKKVLGLLWALGLTSCGGSSGSAGTPLDGGACVKGTDCGAGRDCAYPTADGCAAKGTCVIYPIPGTAHCGSIMLACGCDGSQVGIPCDYPSGYAPAPLKSMNARSCP